jgi:hypothetical protein
MTREQFLGLEACMPRIAAQRLLDRADRGEVHLDVDGGYLEVARLAYGGDEDRAQAAATEYAQRRIKAGTADS